MNINYKHTKHSVYLCDDGTLDTMISVDGVYHRFDAEYASQYRNKKGIMTSKGLKELAIQCIEIS